MSGSAGCQCPGRIQAQQPLPFCPHWFTLRSLAFWGRPSSLPPLRLQLQQGPAPVALLALWFSQGLTSAFLVLIFIEIIIDSCALTRNCTKRSHVCFTQLIPVLAFCKTRACDNQYNDIGTMHWSFSDFTWSTCVHVCVYVYVSVYILITCVGLCIIQCCQNTEQSPHFYVL